MSSFAILVDSGTDVPASYQADYPIYTAPLSILYPEGVYADRVDIASFVGPFDHGFTPEYYEIGTYTDPWGSRWTNIQAGVVGEVKHPVFADYSAMKGYTPPTAQFLREWESNKPALEAKIAAARKAGKFIIGGWVSVF